MPWVLVLFLPLVLVIALAGVCFGWLECCPRQREAVGSILLKAHTSLVDLSPCWGVCKRQQSMFLSDINVSLSPFLPLSLISMGMSSDEDKKQKEQKTLHWF